MKPILPPVHVRGLTVHRAGAPVLDGLDLQVEPGDRVGIVGANGSGKSTLMLVLTGLLTPQAGEVSLAGHPPGSADAAAQLGWLPDVPRHPRLRIRDLIAVVAGLHGHAPVPLTTLGLPGLRPDQYADRLSQGQARRLALALARLHAPTLLLLDEPSTGLDRAGALHLREQVQAHRGAVLATGHHAEDLDGLVDRVWVLRAGRLEDA